MLPWRSDCKTPENGRAQGRDVQGVVQPVGSREVASITGLRAGLTLGKKRKSRDVNVVTSYFSQSRCLDTAHVSRS